MLFLKYAAAVGLMATQVLADGASIVQALNVIDTGVGKLNTSVVDWDGGLLTAVPILLNAGSLISEINQGTSTAQQSANLTINDALSVYQRTLSLAQDVNITLTSVIAAKPKADKALIGFVFLGTLKEAKSATDQLGAAIVAKVPSGVVTVAQSVVAQFDASFNQAIAAYSSSSILSL